MLTNLIKTGTLDTITSASQSESALLKLSTLLVYFFWYLVSNSRCAPSWPHFISVYTLISSFCFLIELSSGRNIYYEKIIIHSASADLSAKISEDSFWKHIVVVDCMSWAPLFFNNVKLHLINNILLPYIFRLKCYASALIFKFFIAILCMTLPLINKHKICAKLAWVT